MLQPQGGNVSAATVYVHTEVISTPASSTWVPSKNPLGWARIAGRGAGSRGGNTTSGAWSSGSGASGSLGIVTITNLTTAGLAYVLPAKNTGTSLTIAGMTVPSATNASDKTKGTGGGACTGADESYPGSDGVDGTNEGGGPSASVRSTGTNGANSTNGGKGGYYANSGTTNNMSGPGGAGAPTDTLKRYQGPAGGAGGDSASISGFGGDFTNGQNARGPGAGGGGAPSRSGSLQGTPGDGGDGEISITYTSDQP